ncbi:bifunctional diguanylate cyclase/phosphodiesterase [Micromonospora phytophila]|uniref:putative bifunctional diguanylate cyclase/phosphodiesterase n=1 Tax=Micromonospora phytophila TaxID=709888 RepID=UPI002030B989|nr:bifunctional diguanylate cyclase/phosphodiesterase [Micromonospora phytophila]MCM0676979.1 bifunctional diguanylate cyclase/phosphodiesterase [Micromonospora phytophila]
MLLLTGAVLLTALAAAAVGLTLPPRLPADDPLGGPARFGVAVAVFAVAQLARLRFRTSAGMVSITWGEAALIVCLYLVPAGWLPSATLLGAGFAWSAMSLFGDRRPVLEVVRIAASLTAATALAVSVSTALGEPLLAAPTPALALAVIAGSVTYLFTTAWLGGATLALRHGVPIGPPLLAALRGKLLMFVGNVAVGLVVVALLELDPRWLLLLPPPLWLLQQTYRHRLRADRERRTWRAFAEATAALNQLDERGVATAAVTGALALFNAELVDVDVARGDGGWRRYRGDPGGQVVDREVGPPAGTDSDEHELLRTLTVGAAQVGELRVRFPRSAPPSARERDAVAAFGDALAAALHDAATHRELRLVTARSSYEAVHDQLTGLVNRAAMLSKGDQALRQLAHDHPVALLLLDINQFKEVNDTLGHAAGDQLLRLTANRLGTLARSGDLLGRLGGDEFALLLTSVPVVGDRTAPMAYALRQAREIAERLAAPTEVAGVRMSIEVSVGVVVADAGTADLTELLRRADIAMYQAKEGGGSVAAYDSAWDAASTDQLALLAELREALEVDDQLVLALQPAVDLATGAPTGVEALIRWRHPRRGLLSPQDFIRPVENSEQLGAFTRYVLDKALAVAADWARAGLDVPISVNLSARSLLDRRLPAEVAAALRQHQVPPHRLVLEITETVVMSELEVIDEVLATLRSMGVQLAVDDFGTGFSSLTFLTRITVDELKVDRSFVIRMVDSPEAAAIVRTTVGLAHELGLRVVAEGVETAEQRLALTELGCTAAQGYHFFKPMPPDKIAAVLGSLLDEARPNVFPLRADGAS